MGRGRSRPSSGRGVSALHPPTLIRARWVSPKFDIVVRSPGGAILKQDGFVDKQGFAELADYV
jgi:hypothetical protein